MGSKAKPPPDAELPDDGAEFRAAVGPVRPLRPAPPTQTTPPPRRARISPTVPPAAPIDIPVIAPNATVRLAQPGVPGRVLRRLDGDRFDAEAELDLHGLTADQATRALHRFVADCLAAGCERVRVIHGKGGRAADNLPVLKPLAIASLKGHPAVLALRSAGLQDGGSGALRVLLRRA